MKLLDTIAGRMGYARIKTGKRLYAAAGNNRLTSNWTTVNTSADSDIRIGLRTLRARSRELAQNNDYARRFLKLVVTNLIGPAGVKFQNKAKDPSGNFDKRANALIEAAWSDWGRVCSLDGQLSWLDIQRIVAETVPRDGEILIKKIRGRQNKYGLALQLLEADHLDETFSDERRRIRMGIEYDEDGRPIAYHLWKNHPGDNILTISSQYERVRVPASDIIHVFIKERPSQSRGVPWMHTAMTRLNNLGGYEEAEIVAARVGASSMGVITTPDGEYPGQKDEDGNIYMEVEPGVFAIMPEGCTFQMFDPKHPAGNFGPFMKATLRGVAAGFTVSYHSLANDLEDVNFSSIRSGTIDERDNWMTLQAWLIQNMCTPIFGEMLDMSLTSGAIPLPYSKIEKFNSPSFKARRWQWVDPEKDINASVIAIDNKLKTRADVLAEQGLDFHEVIDQLAAEEEYIKSKGLSVGPLPKPPAKEKLNAEEN